MGLADSPYTFVPRRMDILSKVCMFAAGIGEYSHHSSHPPASTHSAYVALHRILSPFPLPTPFCSPFVSTVLMFCSQAQRPHPHGADAKGLIA
jgi:hypothetical protein